MHLAFQISLYWLVWRIWHIQKAPDHMWTSHWALISREYSINGRLEVWKCGATGLSRRLTLEKHTTSWISSVFCTITLLLLIGPGQTWAHFKAESLFYRTRESTGTRESKEGESTSPKSWTPSITNVKHSIWENCTWKHCARIWDVIPHAHYMISL